MDNRPTKTTGINFMTARASARNEREMLQLEARRRAANMRRRMSAMREGVHQQIQKTLEKINV